MTIKEMVEPRDLITQSLQTGEALPDDDKVSWNILVDQMLNKKGIIIALRGAGSVNGADREQSDALLQQELIPRIGEFLNSGKEVVILYDGDSDSIEKPDIGYFAGRLLDTFGNNEHGVVFFAVQKRGWYEPKRERANLTNAQDKDYVTYIFQDAQYPGDHNAFTQDGRLVGYSGYHQWYIGASGEIAMSQLHDFNEKVPQDEKRSTVIFRVRNNGNLDAEIEAKLDAARAAQDEGKVAKFQKQLEHRKNIYGAHWDNDGSPNINQVDYPNLELSFVVSA